MFAPSYPQICEFNSDISTANNQKILREVVATPATTSNFINTNRPLEQDCYGAGAGAGAEILPETEKRSVEAIG